MEFLKLIFNICYLGVARIRTGHNLELNGTWFPRNLQTTWFGKGNQPTQAGSGDGEAQNEPILQSTPPPS